MEYNSDKVEMVQRRAARFVKSSYLRYSISVSDVSVGTSTNKLKCTGFYLSQSRMKECDFLSKPPLEFYRYFQYEQNYAQFTVSLIRDF